MSGLLKVTLTGGRASAGADWREDINTERSYSCKIFGGRLKAASTICIPSLRWWIREENLILLDRQGFGNECKRELFLAGLGYQVVSFAYDDVRQQPELIVALLRMLLSRYESMPMIHSELTFAESEIIRLAMSHSYSLRPVDITVELKMNYRRAISLLKSLRHRGWFRPIAGVMGERVVRYELVRNPFGQMVWLGTKPDECNPFGQCFDFWSKPDD
jgi:hypothetical protein